MAKYDWDKLKQKFITSPKKQSLKQFAIANNIPYGLLRQSSSGWLDERRTKHEQKTNKVIDKTIDRQIESDVEMNLRHYNLGSKLLSIVEKSVEMKDLLYSPKSINSLAKTIETLQKVQRIASGVDSDSSNKGDVIKDFVEAVTNGTNEDAGK